MKGKHKILWMIIGVCFLVALFLLAVWLNPGGEAVEPAQVYVIGTQDDADCILLISQGSCIMIDTGEDQDASHILEVLEEQGIKKIDCLILTHPDKDHIGGAPDLLEKVEIGMMIEPDYRKPDERLDTLHNNIKKKGIELLTLTWKKELQCGELKITIYPPEKNDYGKDNNYSLATLVTHGKTVMFFPGDAEKARTREILAYHLPSPVDLYKVAYHGRQVDLSGELIQKLNPRYAVVTAVKADETVTKQLWAVGAEVDYSRGWDLVYQSNGQGIEKISKKEIL